VHAQDGGDGRRATKANVSNQGADRPGSAQTAPPAGQDRIAGHGLCAARPADGVAPRTASPPAAMNRDTGEKTGHTGPAGAPVARLENVTLRYGRVCALDSVSLDVPA